jgi:hypothetical protein
MAQSTFQFLVSDAVGSGDGGVDADRTRKTDEKNMFANLLQTSKKSLQTNLGIQLSVAAVLKQSQIFTGFIGSLFQILGAFVDVALMSVFPILKSSLKFLMKFFDPLQTVAKGVGSIVDAVMMVFGEIGKGYNKIRDVISTIIDYIPGIGGEDTASRGVGLGAGALAARATAKGGKNLGKLVPGAGVALGAYGIFEGFEREGMIGVIKETVNFTLGGLFGGAGFALAGPGGAVGGLALYDLIVKDVTQSILDTYIGGASEKQTENMMYGTTPLGE